MPRPRDYTKGTDMALAALSGALCYWPGCPEPVVREVEGEMFFIGQRAHIHAAFRGGARHDESMSVDDKREFANLILLCKPHHEIVDIRQPERYPAEILLRWKNQREAAPREALERLREVTPLGLRKIVAEGLREHDAKLIGTLGRLERSDREAADLMRSLIDELSEAYARLRESLDPDVINEFYVAARQLSDMQDTLEDFVAAVGMYQRRPPPNFGDEYE